MQGFAGWWDYVGEWQPSTVHFPNGITEVLDRIRERGLVPGLWLEPEVVGVRSPMADRLPDDAFFCRRGRRLAEAGRYHLDLRHPAARAHLDATVDRLVEDLGVGYSSSTTTSTLARAPTWAARVQVRDCWGTSVLSWTGWTHCSTGTQT